MHNCLPSNWPNPTLDILLHQISSSENECENPPTQMILWELGLVFHTVEAECNRNPFLLLCGNEERFPLNLVKSVQPNGSLASLNPLPSLWGTGQREGGAFTEPFDQFGWMHFTYLIMYLQVDSELTIILQISIFFDIPFISDAFATS